MVNLGWFFLANFLEMFASQSMARGSARGRGVEIKVCVRVLRGMGPWLIYFFLDWVPLGKVPFGERAGIEKQAGERRRGHRRRAWIQANVCIIMPLHSSTT